MCVGAMSNLLTLSEAPLGLLISLGMQLLEGLATTSQVLFLTTYCEHKTSNELPGWQCFSESVPTLA